MATGPIQLLGQDCPTVRVCLGGTFHPFHAGHKALLQEATRDAAHVFVGITSGKLAGRPDRSVPPWEQRAELVEGVIRNELGFTGELTVRALDDAAGPAASGDYDAIVVSPETVRGAEAINETRAAADLKPLALRIVSHVLADDLLPLSATRVARGDVAPDGQRLTPLRVVVGSANPVKVAGVDAALGQILGTVERSVTGLNVDSGVPEQPQNKETLLGARNRAREAMAAADDADYAIGVEAGLQQDDGGEWYDVQCCVVTDRLGKETTGWGPAFQYPAWVTRRAREGEMISDILGPIANDPRIGGTTGAIGFLTDGRMDRTALTRHAVFMAFVPRFRPDLYASSFAATA